jgi:hypothetical protein
MNGNINTETEEVNERKGTGGTWICLLHSRSAVQIFWKKFWLAIWVIW